MADYDLGFKALVWLMFGLIFGLFFALLFALDGGLDSGTIAATATPNEEIRQSARSALLGALVFGLVFGLVLGASVGMVPGSGNPFFDWSSCVSSACAWRARIWGLCPAFTLHPTPGAVVDSMMPLRYVRFLDYAAERIFLCEAGGGYIFVHRLLMGITSHRSDEKERNSASGGICM